MMKYLIVECEELGDQWECDANRTPLCMTDDCSTYGFGYEVYELTPENKFRCIKEYNVPLETGIAIYKWNDAEGEKDIPDEIIEKYPGKDRDDFTLKEIKEICKKYHFEEGTPKKILTEISNCGGHGEEINGEWVVIGEYWDNWFSRGC